MITFKIKNHNWFKTLQQALQALDVNSQWTKEFAFQYLENSFFNYYSAEKCFFLILAAVKVYFSNAYTKLKTILDYLLHNFYKHQNSSIVVWRSI